MSSSKPTISSPEKLLSETIRNDVREIKNLLINRNKEPRKIEKIFKNKLNDKDFSNINSLYDEYINEISDGFSKLRNASESKGFKISFEYTQLLTYNYVNFFCLDPGAIVCEEIRQCILRLYVLLYI